MQWLYPNEYGEDKILMLMGPLHIEMAFLNAIGNWLESSGWVDIIIKSEINTPGRADALLKGNHPKRSRYAHQVSCAALSLLLRESYENSEVTQNIEEWVSERKSKSVQFYYWHTVMELEALLLMFIKSVRIGNFEMFISCLEQIAPWMFSLDHTHYARWLPVFINDMKQWATKHPAIFSEFQKGNFVINKTNKPFSCMRIDQAHEQNNKLVKIDGGAVEIMLNDSTALMKWMVAGPEIADMVQAFRNNDCPSQRVQKHHEDSASFEKKFRKVVTKMLEVMRQLGNQTFS